MSEQRIEALEERFAHLDRLVSDLSDVVWKQQREIDQLREQVRQLKDKAVSETGLVDAARNDLPPHY